MPICWLAAAAARSAEATSGRRSSSWEGTPTGTAATGGAKGAREREKLDAETPSKVAIACSYCARRIAAFAAWACAASS